MQNNATVAGNIFLDYLIDLACAKVTKMLSESNFASDRRLLSHLIDETVLFEKEVLDGKFLFLRQTIRIRCVYYFSV